jgi:tetratricopeptide (TPR) repeat protein
MHLMKKKYLVLAMALAMQAGLAQADALTDQAKTLLDAGKSAQAFALLEPQESARAGEPPFDFLFGLAALDVGQNTRAVFALERVLAMDPNNVRARAEIARAYLALGEVDTARKEFETVQKQGVPADVSVTLDRFIAAARNKQDQSKTTSNGYVELTLGYDTNLNLGPNKNSVVIPGLSPFPATLSDRSKANSDAFAQLGGGYNVRVPLGQNKAILAGVSGSERFNGQTEQFDLGNVDGNVGLVLSEGKNVYTVMGQLNAVGVDGQRYRTALGLTGQWQHNYDARNQVSVFGQYSDIHYETQASRDADRWVAGAAYAHMWRDGAVGYASAYLVKEKPQAANVEFIGFDGLGTRVGARASINEKTIVFGNVSYEYRRYAEVDPSFLTKRKDSQFGVVVGASYAFAKDWSLTPQLSLTRNDSNTELNEYKREMVSVAVRREF